MSGSPLGVVLNLLRADFQVALVLIFFVGEVTFLGVLGDLRDLAVGLGGVSMLAVLANRVLSLGDLEGVPA